MYRIILVALLTWAGIAPATAQPAPPSVTVGTSAAQSRPITRSVGFVGRIEAINRVDVRARVTGYVEEVLFKEGDIVQEGAPLFRLEKAPFQAAVQQMQGALIRAQGEYTNANLQRQRAEELVRTSAASVAVRDQRVADAQTAQGNVVSADANLLTAKVNLGYTDMTAPITGRIGRTTVTRGNVVGPDSGTLALIVSQNPMYVTFPVSQREFLRVQQERKKTAAYNLAVRIRFSDGTVYPELGRIDFVDVTVERSTDTVLVRGTIPNPKDQLVDGQLVRVAVESDKPEEKVVIPQAALIADQQGPYVFVVQDGKAVVKRVKLGPEAGTDVVVEDGVTAGEPVVVEGLEALRPGMPVLAKPVTPIQRS